MRYQEINANTIDKWCLDGWEWGKPIAHAVYTAAQNGKWDVYLTPTRPVPHSWFGNIRKKQILGLASGGGQQIPIFAALGADCTMLDYSEQQCRSEQLVADREGYSVRIIRADMTRRLPFDCYVEKVEPIFQECYRILKKGGILLGGYDIGINFAFDESEEMLAHPLPYNPMQDEKLYQESIANGWGIQFSHTLEEQLGGQLHAGFHLTDLYEDTNGEGNLCRHHIPSFVAVRAVK